MENTDFSLNAISYLENRISLVDNKASILLAVQTLFVGLIAYVIKEYFLSTSINNSYCYIFLSLSVAIFFVSIYFLLQTIRPSKHVSMNIYKNSADNKLMWLRKNDSFELDELIVMLKENNPETFLMSLAKTHYTRLQLVRLKYKYYRKANVLIRYYLMFNSCGLLILLVLKLYAT